MEITNAEKKRRLCFFLNCRHFQIPHESPNKTHYCLMRKEREVEQLNVNVYRYV